MLWQIFDRCGDQTQEVFLQFLRHLLNIGSKSDVHVCILYLLTSSGEEFNEKLVKVKDGVDKIAFL